MKKYQTLWLLAVLVCLSLRADLGGREGHGGDPYWYRFYHRAKFGLFEMKKRQLVSLELLKVYESALDELNFEITDETLITTGRVVDDPQHPGKKWVRLDRQKFQQFFENPEQRKDVITFAVHEVFETRGYDLNKEISRKLLFSEEAFGKWLIEEYERERGAGNGEPAPSSFLDDISFAGLQQLYRSPESKVPMREELVGKDPTHSFTGRCVRSTNAKVENALFNALITKGGALKYYFVADPAHGADWFDDRFAKVQTDVDSYTVAQSLASAEEKEGALFETSSTLAMNMTLRKRGDLLLLLQSSTDPKHASQRACLFFKMTSRHNAFEAIDSQFETEGPRLPLKADQLLKEKDTFSLPLRCYNATTYADQPTNGVLVGYNDEERGLKFFAFMDPSQPADTYDHVTFAVDQLKAIDWAADVGFALATPDTLFANLNKPGNLLGFWVRRFDDYKISGERSLGDDDAGAYEILRIVNLIEDKGTLVPGTTAWACTSYEPYVSPPPPPADDSDPTLGWRPRINFASPWPPYYPYPGYGG